MTFSVDYRPRRDGLPYDPATFGGGVEFLRVYTSAARTGVPITSAGPAVRISDGLYRFTVADLPDGEYFTIITWRESALATPYDDRNDRFLLPVPDPTINRLRALIAEPTQDRYTDADLVRFLDARTYVNTSTNPRTTVVDVYAAAADVWDEKGATAQAAGQVVQSVRSGDQAITYADNSATHAATMSRLCRSRAMARSVHMSNPAGEYVERSEQIDAGLGHAYGGI